MTAKGTRRLSDAFCRKTRRAGRYTDGRWNLVFVVSSTGAKRWLFRYPRSGRRREIGLGPYPEVALAEARELALHMRRALQRGEDPRSVLCRTPCGPTFRVVAEALIASKAHEWRHAKHRAQWRSTLEAYAFPVLGRLPVAEITVEHVLAVLKPIWTRRPVTASRLRGRLEAVLDFAQARGWREGANPARWGEIDMEKRVWTIPAERTKAGREHRVPLGPRALALLAGLPRVEGVDLIFPGSGSSMSDMTLSAVIRRMNRRREVEGLDPWRDPHGRPITVHGFRSTFRTWTHEATEFPSEIAEAALGHAIGDRVERAYRRGDALERRRRLMEAWERFLDGRSDPRLPVGKRVKSSSEVASAGRPGEHRLPEAAISREPGAGRGNPALLHVLADGRLVPSSG